jgi:hypothetical protein
MKRGVLRLYQGIHKTARKRAGRATGLQSVDHTKEIPDWWKCTTLQPLEEPQIILNTLG